MISILRTDSFNSDFICLVAQLDAELAERDRTEHLFYAGYNSIQNLSHVVVAHSGEKPVACGAIKPFEDSMVEVKRMFTAPEERGKGVAKKVLQALEKWAVELGYSACVLETGKRQPEAIALYKSCGYELIPNYGQYAGVENSVCFQKNLV